MTALPNEPFRNPVCLRPLPVVVDRACPHGGDCGSVSQVRAAHRVPSGIASGSTRPCTAVGTCTRKTAIATDAPLWSYHGRGVRVACTAPAAIATSATATVGPIAWSWHRTASAASADHRDAAFIAATRFVCWKRRSGACHGPAAGSDLARGRSTAWPANAAGGDARGFAFHADESSCHGNGFTPIIACPPTPGR